MVILNNRPVVDIEVDGVCSWDYPDFCDCYLSAAVWADTLQPLNDEEMETLADTYPDLAQTLALESFH